MICSVSPGLQRKTRACAGISLSIALALMAATTIDANAATRQTQLGQRVQSTPRTASRISVVTLLLRGSFPSFMMRGGADEPAGVSSFVTALHRAHEGDIVGAQRYLDSAAASTSDPHD